MRRTLLVLTLTAAACGGKSGSNADANSANPDAPGTSTPPDANLSTPDAMVSGVVQCPTPVPIATGTTCAATAGTGTAVLLRGDVLADGAVYKDGGVLYDGDTITYVGCDYDSQAGAATATRVDCGGAVISPGLINAHDHLNYDDRWPLPSTAAGMTRYNHRHEWRKTISTPSNKYGTGATSNGMRWNELRQAMNGTTSMAASTSATGMVRNLDEPSSTDTSEGLKGLLYEVFMLGDSNAVLKPNCTWAYDKSELQVALEHGTVTHTSEGVNDYAHQEFLCQSRSANGARDFTEKNVAHIHAVGLTASDYYTMARQHAKMIWSPRSNIALYGMTAQPQVLARLGGTIALGTDWTYSGSATIVRELACAASWNENQLGHAFTDEDLWRMATINAAIATETDDRLGSLATGKLADIAIFAAAPGQLHRAVIDATTDKVALVVRGGKPLSGEAAVVAALGPACDPVTVCGKDFQVCASREFAGTTFATINTAITAATGGTDSGYPAIFCDIPDQEPTCAPSRPIAPVYAGPTADDGDGDGVPDATDNCPTIFNPIRPMDNSVQADVDGDGLGDACDPTPVGDDLDGDTIPNAMDNCPEIANTDQADGDMDGKGDACDPCPTQKNTDSICMPLPSTIASIQNGTITAGNSVIIADVIVTGVDAHAFSVQDPTVTNGQYAGVYAFSNAKPTVAVGDKVTIAGTISEYFDNTELDGVIVQAKSAGTPIAPVALTATQASDEMYEGVLVTVTDVASVVNPYACTADNAACKDTLLWQVTAGDSTAVEVWDDMYTAGTTEWTTMTSAAGTHPSVTGVMFYRFNKRRILPRVAADIAPGI